MSTVKAGGDEKKLANRKRKTGGFHEPLLLLGMTTLLIAICARTVGLCLQSALSTVLWPYGAFVFLVFCAAVRPRDERRGAVGCVQAWTKKAVEDQRDHVSRAQKAVEVQPVHQSY